MGRDGAALRGRCALRPLGHSACRSRRAPTSCSGTRCVRVGARALGVVGSSSGAMGLSVPRALELRRRSAASCRSWPRATCARSKSGFLTVISVLVDRLGVGVSSCALLRRGRDDGRIRRRPEAQDPRQQRAHPHREPKTAGGFQNWRELLDDVRLVPGVHAATPVVGGEAMASSADQHGGRAPARRRRPVRSATVIDLVQQHRGRQVQVPRLSLELLDKLMPGDEPIGRRPRRRGVPEGAGASSRPKPEEARPRRGRSAPSSPTDGVPPASCSDASSRRRCTSTSVTRSR